MSLMMIFHLRNKTDANAKAGSFIEISRNGVSASARSGGVTSMNEEMIYNTIECQREYSTPRAPSHFNEIDIVETKHREGNVVFVWYIKMLARSLRKIVYWLGDEEESKQKFDDVADKIK
jgi:recombinational DNA repair protein RecT